MPALDFKEIPAANAATGAQDTFELFAEDVLESMGYKVLSSPNRGPDGGRDLIVEELRRGVSGTTSVRWLVSCKHFAHSGKSVGVEDEQNLLDRVRAADCDGFLGVYSTLPSSGLAARFEGLALPKQVLHREAIERHLLGKVDALPIARRYMPRSADEWVREHPRVPNVMVTTEPIRCDVCGDDLLEKRRLAIYVLYFRDDDGPPRKSRVEHVAFCCKGDCDRTLQERYWRAGLHDRWDDIDDLFIPPVFLSYFTSLVRDAATGGMYAPEALERMLTLFWAAFPRVARELTTEEQRHVEGLLSIPSYLGGFG